MYDGDIVRITLLCKNEMAGVIIDRFGKDTPMIPADDDNFEAKVDMALSFLFLGWVASMGDAIKVITPDEAVEQMREMVKGLNEIYG
ncbi:MAG: WYL domain-containing protein [Eubacterium sp.]|nr:WYL domain-containing protein [Eubacterium sp.]